MQQNQYGSKKATTELTRFLQQGVIVWWHGERDYTSNDPRSLATEDKRQVWSKPAIITAISTNGDFTIASLDNVNILDTKIKNFRKSNTQTYCADISKEIEIDCITVAEDEAQKKDWIEQFIADNLDLFNEIHAFIELHSGSLVS